MPLEPSESKPEIRFKARPMSRGVAIGQIVNLHGFKKQFFKINLENTQIAEEILRFKTAVRAARRQVKKLIVENKNGKSDVRAEIFEAHLLILKDKTFLGSICGVINSQKINSEWAVKIIADETVAKFKAIADENLREKYLDLEDVAERILNALGDGETPFQPLHDAIIAAVEVSPSTLTELIASRPRAVITENGGWTSHTFIIARELNLPAVTGLKNFRQQAKTGDNVIVDGFLGLVILNPTNETVRKYQNEAADVRHDDLNRFEKVKKPFKTLDGFKITVRANAELPEVFRRARRTGAEGIGLYRSEFLFNQFKDFPSEDEQFKAYRKIGEAVGGAGVRIRTFDLNHGQTNGGSDFREKNPALGLRAIRLGIRDPQQFRIQIRAILRAAHQNSIDIMLPMISDLSEIMQAKQLIDEEKNSLQKAGIPAGSPQIGAMIEVPSAVLMVEQILDEVDYICVGTNDLVQYLLAVDRDNEAVSSWFRTLHPAVLKAVGMILKAAQTKDKPAIICGEMAGSIYYVPVLIGLGARNLSMNVSSILPVGKIISNIALSETVELVRKIADCRRADEVEKIVFDFLETEWVHLYSAENAHK